MGGGGWIGVVSASWPTHPQRMCASAAAGGSAAVLHSRPTSCWPPPYSRSSRVVVPEATNASGQRRMRLITRALICRPAIRSALQGRHVSGQAAAAGGRQPAARAPTTHLQRRLVGPRRRQAQLNRLVPHLRGAGVGVLGICTARTLAGRGGERLGARQCRQVQGSTGGAPGWRRRRSRHLWPPVWSPSVRLT